ncbi:hypothetical protein TRFO_04545 [Tritrichomonas foetus]|uniref:RRM domain-containing protein n=1 Tax=Tritrichomonas foetus TaxID=1144522 RepID=A0A1J4KI22_9EUKA|nr:hypothetical protein TRFO_04545 [Tritrichomonas foetus]|eukprot:OHT09468.1 hypothetical protein TRFO_04545 [Tritrichomonas foetus]
MLPKHYRSNGSKIFLIQGINLKEGARVNISFAFHSTNVFKFNDDNYLCFYTKTPLLVDDVIPILKKENKIHVSPSQVMHCNFDNSFGTKDKDSQKDTVVFYAWHISESIIDDFLQLVYGLARVKAEMHCFYCKITTEERTWHSLIPLLRLFDVDIAFNLDEIPAVYVEDISDTISDDNVSKYFNRNADGIVQIRRDLNHDHDRRYAFEFEDQEKADAFLNEFQDFLIKDTLLNVKPMINDDIFDQAKKTEINIANLDLSPLDRHELRVELEEKYGPIYHLRLYREDSGKCSANVIFFNHKDGLRAIYDKDYEVSFIRTKLWMFNLPPETTEQEIIEYFPSKIRPVSVKICPEEEKSTWWAIVQFNTSKLNDVEQAEQELNNEDRDMIGSFLPFGYIPYHGGHFTRQNIYKRMCVNYMKNNSIFIEKTTDVTVEKVIFLLESNGIDGIRFMHCFPKEKGKQHNFEVTVVSLRDEDDKRKALRALQDESIEGEDIEVREFEKDVFKRRLFFPRKNYKKPDDE